MSTIKDVAKKAGVSISTASYALNNKDNVAPETKAKILAVAKELNYTPNLVAKQLKTNETKIIGVFVSHISGFVVNQFVEKAKEIFEKEKFLVVSSNGQSANQLLLNRYVDAAVIMDLSIPNETIGQFANYDSPIYLLDRQLMGTNILAHPIQEADIVESLMTEMINKGYQHFAFLGAKKELLQNTMRYEGFLRALNKHHIDEHLYLEGKGTIQSGYQIALDLVSIKERPDFIFSANDYMAIGLIQGFNQKGIHIPNDIAICGFDNYTFGSSIKPQLSSIGIDYGKLGLEAAKVLLSIVKKNEYKKAESQDFIIYLRESC
ncbi:MAG: LacI family transcriptional regulator [Bacillota bacterium]|nr:MAG: LacI family transcriptional regulator [Bacillota bacterium]